MSSVRRPKRSTISPPKVLTVRSNSELWRVIRAPSVPLSRANFSASSLPWFFISSSNALICSESVSCADSVWLTTFATSALTVASSDSLALSPLGRVPGAGPRAGVVDLADEIAAAQLEFEQKRIAGVLQGVMHLFGALGDAF